MVRLNFSKKVLQELHFVWLKTKYTLCQKQKNLETVAIFSCLTLSVPSSYNYNDLFNQAISYNKKACNIIYRLPAVREGFEPSVQFNPYGSLANYWFEPLTHLTVSFKKDGKNKRK